MTEDPRPDAPTLVQVGVESAYVFEGTRANFDALVLENSTRGLVVLNFWTRRSGPSLRQYPILDKLVHESRGRWLLVNIDTEEQGTLARAQGVISVPTLKLVRDREVVASHHGYLSEAELRRVLQPHAHPDTDAALTEALRIYGSGDLDGGLQRLADIAISNPRDMRVPTTMAKLMMRQDRPDDALRLLQSLPGERREEPAIRNLSAHAALVVAARRTNSRVEVERILTADANDLDARFALAALALIDDDYEGAMAALLELKRRGDKRGLNGLLALFDLLGEEHPLVARFRPLKWM